MSLDSQQLLHTAIDAARIAGAYLLEQAGKLDRSKIVEKKANDFVTEVDRGAERLIIDRICREYPEHQFLAEESGRSTATGDIVWIIDPLDGTTNYIQKIPFYAVSIAAYNGTEILAGVVFNPKLSEFFSAAKGLGAYLNDAPIRVSTEPDFSRAFLATGFPHQRKRNLPPFLTATNEIFFGSAGIRRLGSAALDLCYTACGRFDGYWELGLNPWDCAAGCLLVSEAGGTVSDFWGDSAYLENGHVIAANPAVHKQLQFHLSNHFTERLT